MTDHPTPPPAAQTREPGFYWVNIPESGWYAARLAVIESGPVIDGILVADANERVEIWAIPGQPFGTTDIAGWEIGPRIPTPAERPGDAALAEAIRWVSTLEMHSAHIYDRLTPADIQRLDALEDAARRALSPAPRDGGWNAAIEAAAQCADERSSVIVRQLHRGLFEDEIGNSIRALARPLPAQPTEDGR